MRNATACRLLPWHRGSRSRLPAINAPLSRVVAAPDGDGAKRGSGLISNLPADATPATYGLLRLGAVKARVRMWADIEALAGHELHPPHLIEKDEGLDHLEVQQRLAGLFSGSFVRPHSGQ